MPIANIFDLLSTKVINLESPLHPIFHPAKVPVCPASKLPLIFTVELGAPASDAQILRLAFM